MIESPHYIFPVDLIPGLSELWDETCGDPRVRIAVLDGPVDTTHPDLSTANLDILESDVVPQDIPSVARRHGTHVASVIFGQHKSILKGIAPLCKGLIIPVFGDRKDGSVLPCSQSKLAGSIKRAIQDGAHVINISGGEFAPFGGVDSKLEAVVQECAERGILIVAAAGNQGCNCLHMPGALPFVLAVGAMDAQGTPLSFSNWGTRYRSQGILAPGVGILGANPGGGIVTNTGTSYATPIVSGIVALLMSVGKKYGNEITAQDAGKTLLESTITCIDQPVSDCRRLIGGRLNIKGAMSRVIKLKEIQNRGIIMIQPDEMRKLVPPNGNSKVGGAAITPDTEVLHTKVPDTDASTVNPSTLVKSSSPIAAPAVKAEGTLDSTYENQLACTESLMEMSNIDASHCSCQDKGQNQMVFAIGHLGFDFESESRRDSIAQHMIPTQSSPAPSPHNPSDLLEHLKANPWDGAAILWTLNMDGTSIYVIRASGQFEQIVYARLREFLNEQLEGVVERVSVPGYITGSQILLSGQLVPVIQPDLRGLCSWNTDALVNAVSGNQAAKQTSKKPKEPSLEPQEGIHNFLTRIYDELRNMGASSPERAINYAATNAFQVVQVFKDAVQEELHLDKIEVEQSPICRPGSDCWDVKLTFFNPKKVFEQAGKVYRFTVDVSDVVPVLVGNVRSWYIR